MEFVLGEMVQSGVLQFEKNTSKGWERVETPDWAREQVWQRFTKEQLK